MDYFNTLLFGLYPYIAFTVFLVGSAIRYDMGQYTWKTGSSQMLDTKGIKKGSVAFHVGIIAVLAGHFVGLLTPHQVWDALGVTAPIKQLFAMGAGGLFGLICLYGIVILLKRRLTNPRVRATSTNMDILILVLIFVQLLLGLTSILFSFAHLEGVEMYKMMGWAQNIVTFDPMKAAASLSTVGLIYKLHILLGMTLFLLFPFSRLVHIWSVPVGYLTRRYQIVRTKG